MSLKLLKRSLEIVEADFSTKHPKKSRKSRKSDAIQSDSVFDLMPEKQKLFIKAKINGKQIRYEEIARSAKLNVTDVKRAALENGDKTNENLCKLLRMSGKKIDPKTTEKLLGRQKQPEEKPKEQESIFTEDDFKAFEKEYFNS